MELRDIQKASRFMSQHLDGIDGIGSEKTVYVRRLINFLGSNSQHENHSVILSGSKGEGLDFNISDEDVMLVDNKVIVVQPHDDIPTTDVGKTVLVMDNTDCRPGYTLLRLHQLGMIRHRAFIDALTEFNGSMYLSSVVYSSNMLMPGHHLHGPCSTSTCDRNHERDHACCFHCRSWPDTLSDFRYRTLHCGWPSRQLVNYIVRNGCHFVAIGDKHSNMFAMQWRISFAKAEQSLVMSFNHVQFKTYALLKIFLKECIERDQSIKELLCSYFMKTIIFHAIEHSTSSQWMDDTIFQCFWFCFTILLEFVHTGYCPNYFVLTHNLFLANVTGHNRRMLLRVLSKYHRMGWTCLLQCPILQRAFQSIHVNRPMCPLAHHHQAVTEECRQDSHIRKHYDSSAMGIIMFNMPTVLKSVSRVVLKCSDDLSCDIAMLYLMRKITSASSTSISDLTRIRNKTNKYVYRQIRMHKRLLHLTSATDICGGLLSLATFYYNVGCYNKASEIATRVVFACQQRALLQAHSCHWHGEYKNKMCGKGYTLLHKAKHSFVFNYTINQQQNTLYPPELDLEVRAHQESLRLPPLPYAIFLLVLSTYRLGNIDQSRTVLDDLLATLTNDIYGVRYYPILHSLIGICYQLLGDTKLAIRAFDESCRQLPNSQAAVIRIADLLQTRRKERGNTGIDALDYYNVQCQYHGYGNVDGDDDDGDDDDRLYYHKTMYNTDPVSVVDLS